MPALGLGVFLAPADQTADAVRAATGTGYRLIDTDSAYMNERAVAEGIRASGVDREEPFVTTKPWPGQHGDQAVHGVESGLEHLGHDYIDLYLLQWPVPTDFDATVQAYRGLELLRSDGRIRAIGVCNFLPHHLQRLEEETGLVPALNQIELNPFYRQPEAQAANAARGIVTQTWAPIGGTYQRNQDAVTNGAATPLEHPLIVDLAGK